MDTVKLSCRSAGVAVGEAALVRAVSVGVVKEPLMLTTTAPLLVVVEPEYQRVDVAADHAGRSPPGDWVGLPTVTVAVGAWLPTPEWATLTGTVAVPVATAAGEAEGQQIQKARHAMHMESTARVTDRDLERIGGARRGYRRVGGVGVGPGAVHGHRAVLGLWVTE